jgi:membrane protein implicated in regulation of membrane protease activity
MKEEGENGRDVPAEAEAGLSSGQQKLWMALAAVLVLALAVGAGFVVFALARNPAQAETVRDIVIIFMGAESLLLGLALIILMVQLARLTALLQDEVRPMLRSTNDTIETLRGTTRFLSDNLVSPVIRANGAAAAVQRVVDLVRRGRPR